MKNHYITCIIVLSIFFLNITVLSAQKINDQENGYIAFDKLVGIQNTNLYEGILHAEKYRTINDYKQFFKSTRFLNGEIWYKGQPYFNQSIKYDVYEDELLLKLEDKGGSNTLKLLKTNIDSFNIDKHYFVNLKPEKKLNKIQFGFYEVMFQGHSFTLYMKHRKNLIEKNDERIVYYEFIDTKKKYVLLYAGEYHVLNSKKSMISLFPDHKKQINESYKRAKKIHNNDSSALMVAFVKELESIL